MIQASVLPPGGTWSAPVNVSTDAFGGPVIGMDGSGNAIVAWTGGGKQIRTASLPAGGNWTAVDTLDPAVDGFALGLAVNSAGSAIITWAEPARTIMAASGTILGGFAAPVTLAADVTRTSPASGPAARITLDAYESPALGSVPQVNGAYLHGHTDVVLSNSGEASVASALKTTATVHNVTTRSAAGTWSTPMGLPLPGPSSAEPDYETAIDGAGNVITVYQQGSSVDLIRLPAGSSTWSTPVVLAASASLGMVAGDTAGTFVAAVDTSSGLDRVHQPARRQFRGRHHAAHHRLTHRPRDRPRSRGPDCLRRRLHRASELTRPRRGVATTLISPPRRAGGRPHQPISRTGNIGRRHSVARIDPLWQGNQARQSEPLNSLGGSGAASEPASRAGSDRNAGSGGGS